MNRAIFLDRDGVINPMVYDPEHGFVDSPANPAQFELCPDASTAVRVINEMGFLAVIASNQPGIAKGKYVPRLLDAMREKMLDGIAAGGGRIDGVYYCLHHPEARLSAYRVSCDCRKPKPGLLVQASLDLKIDLRRSYMVGDGLVDVAAGRSAGCRTVLLGALKCDLCRLMDDGNRPDFTADGLLEAVQLIRTLEEENA